MSNRSIRSALEQDNLVDVSTVGRRSGATHRIEIWFHFIHGEIYLTGRPAPRDWYANMVANPQIIFHLKESIQADLPATAFPITLAADRRAVLTQLLKDTEYWDDLEAWIEGSPLVRINI